ncbi:MAG: type VII toxin-antitoxin system HepT family RNase toxin [Burkholderiales bacterium]
MTDSELIAKKLAEIETYVRELRTIVNPDDVLTDVKEERFAAHTLQLAIQSALDVASHIVSDERLGEPRTNRELFTLLEQHGWIESPLAQRLQNMVGFRNILVHGYQKLDLSILVDVLRNRLPDLVSFVEAIRARLPRG